ncbi:MAG TPA: hypothetical protein VHF24_01185 [Acidimicrobiales bacterium]|nr:hypothetical protein [Acidimicrobiales bacterium]
MQRTRPWGAAVAALALLFVVLSGPAVADSNWGRNGRRGGGGGQSATFNVGGLPGDFQSRIMDRLGSEPALQAAGIGVELADGIIQLVGRITTEVLNLVKGILAQFGVSFPINVLPGGDGAVTTTTAAPPPSTTTTAAPGGGGGGGGAGVGDGGGALPGFQENLLSLIRQLVDRVLALIRDFLPV